MGIPHYSRIFIFFNTNVSLPFEGHNVAYQCKGLDQSNIVCEYEENLSTNEKVITEKQNFNTIVKEQCNISRSSEGQGYDAIGEQVLT